MNDRATLSSSEYPPSPNTPLLSSSFKSCCSTCWVWESCVQWYSSNEQQPQLKPGTTATCCTSSASVSWTTGHSPSTLGYRIPWRVTSKILHESYQNHILAWRMPWDGLEASEKQIWLSKPGDPTSVGQQQGCASQRQPEMNWEFILGQR